jgi:hypothetical protein
VTYERGTHVLCQVTQANLDAGQASSVMAEKETYMHEAEASSTLKHRISIPGLGIRDSVNPQDQWDS